ncbi:hypothetical protein [Weissella minor]|uniref:Uncharacterized protein n=1 Tax=Weissella minor TaxID=1620 RepID=A0A0R2JJT0_9LACO|nr:hypothetical protein [Weissella minor]KRN77529.1 hypothetical protein IV67_GL001587 [Weissella minor]
MISPAILLGMQIFAAVMILPTVIYSVGHRLMRPFPRVFNALHIVFGGYMLSVLLAALTVLIVN